MPDKRRRYDYDVGSYEQAVKRANDKGSMFDSLFKDVKIYGAKQGANLLRIMPPLGVHYRDNHYGLKIHIHYEVGPRNDRYLCLRENDDSPYDRCPICDELHRLGNRASKEERDQYLPKPSYIYYVVDRDNEKEGVQVYMASIRTDSEISSQTFNQRNGVYIDVVNPDDGYDLEFTRQGTGRNGTRYKGFKFMREASPLADSERRSTEWLDTVIDRPLSSILNFYPPDRLKKVLFGEGDDEEDKAPRGGSSRRRDEDDELHQSSRNRRDEDDAPHGGGRNRRDEDEERTSSRRSARDDDDASTSRDRGRARPEAEEEDRETARPRRPEPADDDRPPRSSRRSEPEPEEEEREPPARSRRAVVEDDESPVRGSSRREESASDDKPPRGRSRPTSEELDDEIPSEGRRRAQGNGRSHDEDEVPSDRGSRRTTAREDNGPAPREERESRSGSGYDRLAARLAAGSSREKD